MYLVNGGSQKTSSSHSCDTVMPLSLRRRDWLAAGVRRPLKNASPILSGAGCGTARHALQKLPQSSARFGLSAVPPQAGPTRPGPAPARKQENRRLRSRRRGRRVRGPRRHGNRRTGGYGAAGRADAFGARAGTKTGEQEIFYGSPSGLLFSSSRLDHARRGPARTPSAQTLLATTALSQEQIALACGFCDASHLGAAFRRHVGRPPSAFRVKREA